MAHKNPHWSTLRREKWLATLTRNPCTACAAPMEPEPGEPPSHYKSRKTCGYVCRGKLIARSNTEKPRRNRRKWLDGLSIKRCCNCGQLMEPFPGEPPSKYQTRRTCGKECLTAWRITVQKQTAESVPPTSNAFLPAANHPAHWGYYR